VPAAPALAQWTPPIGIPAPSFGITQVAPARPNPWTAQVPGYYYVEPTHPSSTDSNNQYGTPARPRKLIPTTLPAGSVVEVHGTYATRHTSPSDITANGTAAAPVWIRGQSSTSRPVMTRNWEVSGSYVILENLEFANAPPDDDGIVLLAPLNHGVLRFSDVHGNLAGGGLSVTSFSSAVASDIVVYANTIHDNGDVNATFDQDIHGIEVNSDVNHLWVVDNEMARNSGDGIQINAGSIGSAPSLHHVYVGRNVSHHNKQNGFWSKQSVDVIFSQNTAYGHRPGNSSSGAGMGFQYAPERIWFLFNNIYDNELGIYVANDNDLGTGQNSYFIGNLITNIRSSGGFQAGSAYQNAAFVLAGSRNRYLVNNTMYQTDSGICAPGSLGGLFMSNNVISNLTQAQGSHVFIEQPQTANGSDIRNTLFQGTVRIKWGANSPVYSLTSFQSSHPGECGGCRNAEPMFANPAAGDFSLLPTSQAVDTGVADAVYTTFQTLYGISIARDFVGTPRPQGAAWDMGAYERATPPDVTANDGSGTESNFATSSLGFVVSLSNASPVPVYVNYATSAGTATAGVDYTSASGTLTIPAFAVSATVPVTILPDLVDEDNETLTLTLSNPINGVLVDPTATGTINDDDPTPLVSAGDCGVVEGDAGTTPCAFDVTLSGQSAKSVTVSYQTAADTASPADFQAASGVVTFPPLTTIRSVTVPVVGDTSVEPDETFRLNLTGPVQAALGDAQGEGLILDDDATPLSQNEILPGWSQEGDLAADPGPTAAPDYYRIHQDPRASYEAIVDGLSGDLTPGLVLERLSSDNVTVLQSSAVVGTGSSVSLRWQNASAAAINGQHLRLRSTQCSTDCGPDDRYRIRFYDTTYNVPRFNLFNNQTTVLLLQNRLSSTVSGTVYFWEANGTLAYQQAFTIAPRGGFTLFAGFVPALVGKSGSVTLTQNGGYGSLAGKVVTIDAGGGFTFDVPLEPRTR
jgi:hypothetical protein